MINKINYENKIKTHSYYHYYYYYFTTKGNKQMHWKLDDNKKK